MSEKIFFYQSKDSGSRTCLEISNELYLDILKAIKASSPPKQLLKLKISDYSTEIKNAIKVRISDLSGMTTAKEFSDSSAVKADLSQAVILYNFFTETAERKYFSFA